MSRSLNWFVLVTESILRMNWAAPRKPDSPTAGLSGYQNYSLKQPTVRSNQLKVTQEKKFTLIDACSWDDESCSAATALFALGSGVEFCGCPMAEGIVARHRCEANQTPILNLCGRVILRYYFAFIFPLFYAFWRLRSYHPLFL